ncbi:hypothetical protein PDY_15790 [Photobacterium damselae subsp. damselae]|nr:hypothetical protein PDY_15790 [Photobacterium damselae subsp. damselae]
MIREHFTSNFLKAMFKFYRFTAHLAMGTLHNNETPIKDYNNESTTIQNDSNLVCMFKYAWFPSNRHVSTSI